MAQTVVQLKDKVLIEEARVVAKGYYTALILEGWGLYRILKEHGYELHRAKYIIPLNGEEKGWYTSEPHVIECLAHYIASGGELVL